jgi:hypothetical protein
MTSTGKATNGAAPKANKLQMSEASIRWDQAEKGFLTDAERIAKNMDVDGKGHLSREQSVMLGSQFQSLKEDNQSIKKQLYGLATLCVLLCIGTIAGTVMAVKNSKDTVVDMKTGVMKVNGSNGGVDIVTVKAQGTTFQTTGSVAMNEETTTDGKTYTKLVVGHCVSSEDMASMWLANEKGTDARLVILEGDNNDGTDEADIDTISSIEPVTTGRASWNQDHIVMGGMTFIPSAECTNGNNRRELLEGNVIGNNDMPSFDSISIHRALKQRVDFLGGRRLIDRRLLGEGYVVAVDAPLIAETPTVFLGTAAEFVILAKAGITNVVTSVITGDIAVSPIAATAMTGFGLTKDSTTTFSKSTEVTGKVYASDYTSPTPAILTTAVSDMGIAYTDSQGRTATNAFYHNIRGGAIGGLELGPGVYSFTTSISITDYIKFKGNASDIFIIKTAMSLTQAANTKVILEGGALAENIFWSIAGTVNIGAGAEMKGILLVATAVTFVTGSKLDGRILCSTAVALDQNTITQP